LLERNALHVSQDAALMQRVVAGDVQAFEYLYDAHARLVFGIALRILDDSALAEDALQSVFLTVWHTPDRFRGGSFTAWICRVARNRSLDMCKQRIRLAEVLDLSGTDVGETFDEKIINSIDAERVCDALKCLTPEQRIPIEMGFFEGNTHQEIADRTATPLGTIKTRIRSGLLSLRKMFEEG
jgi:RNA polymerase sigma-70 factor (ECF subfamily)